MKKILCLLGIVFALAACDKKDPILPGVRVPVFGSGGEVLESKFDVKTLAGKISDSAAIDTENVYHITADNKVLKKSDSRVIFSGFPMATKTGEPVAPLEKGSYIYAGLSTGEVLKLNRSGDVLWTVDLSAKTLLTGGSPVSDISAMEYSGGRVYAATFGGSVYAINAGSGSIRWSAPFATSKNIFISNNLIAFIDLKGRIVAFDIRDGKLAYTKDLDGKEFESLRLVSDDAGELFWELSRKGKTVRIEV